MQIQDITARTMVTAACRVHQAGRIISFCPFSRFFRFKLSPCFVERHPNDYRRIGYAKIHDLFPFAVIVGLGFRRTFIVFSTVIHVVIPNVRAMISTRHILPYQNTFLIAMIIPACRFHFHVLTDHIEAPVFCFLDVEQQCFICRSRIKSVRPPSLVQRAELE